MYSTVTRFTQVTFFNYFSTHITTLTYKPISICNMLQLLCGNLLQLIIVSKLPVLSNHLIGNSEYSTDKIFTIWRIIRYFIK